jgi:hypothetical protein
MRASLSARKGRLIDLVRCLGDFGTPRTFRQAFDVLRFSENFDRKETHTESYNVSSSIHFNVYNDEEFPHFESQTQVFTAYLRENRSAKTALHCQYRF